MIATVRSELTVACAVVVAAICGAQVVNPSPVCMGFNNTSLPASPPGVAVPGTGLFWHFTAATSVTIDDIDFWSQGYFGNTSFAVDVFPTVALGGALAGPAVGTFAYSSPYHIVPLGWVAAPASVAAPLTGGSTYALKIRTSVAPVGTCWVACYDPAGPVQLPYQLAAGCTNTVPPSGTMGLIARLRGPACGPGPPASVVSIGSSGCVPGGPPCFYYPPHLSSYAAPVLGLANWPLSLSFGTNQGPAYVFWAGAVNPTGSPIAPNGCLYFLDPVSLTAYMQLGLEPLLTVTTPGSSTTTFTFALPASPAFAGYVVGVEALVISGSPPPGTASFCQLASGVQVGVSNALQITLGY